MFYIVPLFIVHFGVIEKFRLKPWSAVLLAAGINYVIANLAIDAKWEHKRLVTNSFENPTQEQLMSAVSDGANIVFWLFAGWIITLAYALLCLWFIRYIRK